MGTSVNQLFTRTITLRVVFCFLNKHKEVWVTLNVLAPPNRCPLHVLLGIWVFPKNTFGMCKITTICTIIEPMLWISFFFTDITIIFIGVIFSSIIKSEGMLILFVSYNLW